MSLRLIMQKYLSAPQPRNSTSRAPIPPSTWNDIDAGVGSAPLAGARGVSTGGGIVPADAADGASSGLAGGGGTHAAVAGRVADVEAVEAVADFGPVTRARRRPVRASNKLHKPVPSGQGRCRLPSGAACVVAEETTQLQVEQ